MEVVSGRATPKPDSSLLPLRPQGSDDKTEAACPRPSSLPCGVTVAFASAFVKVQVAPGGLAGKFGDCSEHTTGLALPRLAWSHPTQPTGV